MKSSYSSDSQSQSSTTAESESDDFYTDAEWPDACPVPAEQNLISIACGITFHSWALHGNTRNNQYHPLICWQTAPIQPSNGHENHGEYNTLLYQLLPPQVRCIIYGTKPKPSLSSHDDDDAEVSVHTKQNDADKGDKKKVGNRKSRSRRSSLSVAKISEDMMDDVTFYKTERAVAFRATFRVPAISVYIIGRDADQVSEVAKLFRKIPSKVFRLSTNDFIIPMISNENEEVQIQQQSKNENGTQGTFDDDETKGMDVHLCCKLQGYQYLYPRKSFLMIDTGACHKSPTTYAAIKESGALLGGGISPSIGMKLHGLFQQSKGSVPYVTKEFLHEYIRLRRPNACPVAFKDSIADTVLKETILFLSNIVMEWTNKIHVKYDSKDEPEDCHTEKLDSRNATEASTTKNAASSSQLSNSVAPVVIFTGIDFELVHRLLFGDDCDFHYQSDGSTMSVLHNAMKIGNIIVEAVKPSGLLHHGIQYVLLQNNSLKGKEPNDDIRDILVGQRVATMPYADESEISAIVFRNQNFKPRAKLLYGSVISIIRNDSSKLDKNWYSVFWDKSGSIDDLEATRLYGKCDVFDMYQ
jgi:pantothenate kinase type III